MAIKMKIAGSKPATTRKTSASKSTRKPANRGGVGKTKTTKKTPTRKPAAKPAEPKPMSRRSSVPQTDERTLNRFLKQLSTLGEKRAKAEEAHKAAVQAVREAAAEALDAGVPMLMVSTATGISRQWLYKMQETGAESTNVSGSKSEAKSAVKRTTTAKKTTTKKPARKPAAKKPAKARMGGIKMRIKA